VILTFLSACNLPGAPGADDTGGTSGMPGWPVFEQYILDCQTADLASPGQLTQPGPGCDDWNINRYERPFNAETQDEYYPDVDLLFADFGRSGSWYYLRLAVEGSREGMLNGVYGAEFDWDDDGRGDMLLAAQSPAELEDITAWSKTGVTVWKDGNNDVGDQQAKQPDTPYQGDGYDQLVFNQGEGDDPDAAWARAFFGGPGEPTYIEIAFKSSLLEGHEQFYWTIWGDQGIANAALFDYHDAFRREEAGDVYQGMDFFPANDIYSVDNACVQLWGAEATGDDPWLCINDTSVFPPDPGDGGDECPPVDFEDFKDWFYSLYPQEYPQPTSLLDSYYQSWVLDGNCELPPPPDFPGGCPPVSFDDWKDWWYSQNYESYPQPYSYMLTLYDAYVAGLACESPTPPPPPPDLPGCPGADFDTYKAWYYALHPEDYPLPISLMMSYWQAYLDALDCPTETPTTIPTITQTPTMRSTFTPTDTPTRPPTGTPTNTLAPLWTATPTEKEKEDDGCYIDPFTGQEICPTPGGGAAAP
jgi:hypothetical protein